jgi:hypothetical protein
LHRERLIECSKPSVVLADAYHIRHARRNDSRIVVVGIDIENLKGNASGRSRRKLCAADIDDDARLRRAGAYSQSDRNNSSDLPGAHGNCPIKEQTAAAVVSRPPVACP